MRPGVYVLYRDDQPTLVAVSVVLFQRHQACLMVKHNDAYITAKFPNLFLGFKLRLLGLDWHLGDRLYRVS